MVEASGEPQWIDWAQLGVFWLVGPVALGAAALLGCHPPRENVHSSPNGEAPLEHPGHDRQGTHAEATIGGACACCGRCRRKQVPNSGGDSGARDAGPSPEPDGGPQEQAGNWPPTEGFPKKDLDAFMPEPPQFEANADDAPHLDISLAVPPVVRPDGARLCRSFSYPLDGCSLRDLERVPTPPEQPAPAALLPGLKDTFRAPTKRVLYYDFWRTLCIVLITLTHADELYAEWNVMGVQQWVLPIVVLISGSLWARSRMPMLGYIARLLMYFSIGVFLNWSTVAAATQQKWWGDMLGRKCVFQVAFLGIFVVSAIGSTPLKRQLAPGSGRNAGRVSMSLYASALLCVVVGQVVLWQRNVSWLDQIIRISAESLVTCLLAASLAHFLPEARKGYIGWALLLWIYTTRVANREERPGSDWHLGEIFIWACFVQRVPLAHQAALGEVMTRLWPLWVIACGLLIPPGVRNRADQKPFHTPGLRARQYLPELIVVVAFTVIPSAGPEVAPPLPGFLKPEMPWLTKWSLFAFVTHRAVYYLVPAMPWGFMLMMATCPASVVLLRRWPSWAGARGRAAEPPDTPQHAA